MSAHRGALAAVAAVDQLHGYAFVVLAPEIARGLGLSTAGLTTVALARGVGFALVGATVGAAVRAGRARGVATLGARVRAGALVVGAATSPVVAATGLAIYGAAGASVPAAHPQLLRPADREVHRLAARLGNVAAPVIVGVAAIVAGWRIAFVAMALVSGAAALRARAFRDDDTGPDDTDRAAERFAAVPGGRTALTLIAAAAVTEFPLHVLVFAHLGGALHIGVPGRALFAAVAELIGVVGNVVLGQRTDALSARPPRSVALGLSATVCGGFATLMIAMTVSSPTLAVAALAVGSVAVSVVIPFLAIGTRAVLAAAVPRRAPLGATAWLAVGLLAVPGGDAVLVVVLAVVPAAATLAVARMVIRHPAEASAILEPAVAKVTSDERMVPTPVALDQT
ncbi:MAG TPA: hypothetical protein VFB78_00570 [Acidimicrobiales bacterium]|nr:hypothetical protein [Acidimicrobiales bacterium]